MASTARLQVEVVGDTRSVEAAMARASRATSRFGRSAIGQTGAMQALRRNFALVAAAAGGLAIVGLKRVTDAAAESEASSARLGAQLQTLGKNTVGVRNNIESTVQSISRLSGFDDEDLQDAFTGLVRTTGDVAKAQGQLGLVADIARGRQISLSSATQMVNRANVGSIGGLKRLGIEVDKNTTKEEAFALLREKFAGQAEAFGNTAAGAQARLGVATENAMEAVGVALTPVIIAFANFASETLPQVVDWVMRNKEVVLGLAGALGALMAGLAVAKAINTFSMAFGVLNTVMNANPILRIVSLLLLLGTALVTAYQTSSTFRNIVNQAFTAIKTVAGPVISWFMGPAKMAFDVIKNAVMAVAALVRGDFTGAWNGLKGIGTAILNGIVNIIKGVPMAVWNAAVGILKAAYDLGRQIVEWIGKGIASLPGLIKQGLSNLFGLAGDAGAVNPYLNAMQGAGAKIPEAVGKGIGQGKGKVSSAFSVMTGGAAASAKEKGPGQGSPVGKALSQGVAAGVRAGGPDVSAAISEVVRQGIAQAKQDAGIKSPSEVTKREIGWQLVMGAVVGVRERSAELKKAMAQTVSGASTRGAFEQLRQQAASATSGIVDMFRQARVAIYSAQAGFSGNNQSLNELRGNYNAAQELRRETQLIKARDDAEANADLTEAERQAARDALADFYTEKEIARLESEAAKQAETDSKAVSSLASRFQQGLISADQFQTELTALIGGDTGATLGQMFGTEWTNAFNAAIQPALQIIREGLGGATGADTVTVDRSIYNAKLEDWNREREAFKAELARLKKSGKKLTDAEKRSLVNQYGADTLAGWDRIHKKPVPMARGGILRRAVLAGEAGPEAVIPLTGGRGRAYMSRVMDDVMRAGGRAGSTVVVNVAGNEFSAEEFARKIGPELRRQIALTGSY